MLGSANFLLYVLSGKWQPDWAPGKNRRASYRHGANYRAFSSELRWPGGWEFVKGFLLQRRYFAIPNLRSGFIIAGDPADEAGIRSGRKQ
jgi:hypothetical protein